MKRFAKRFAIFGLLGLITTVLMAWAVAIRTDAMTGPRRNFRTGMFMLEFPAPAQHTTWTFFPITRWGALQITSGNVGPEEIIGSTTIIVERLAEDQEVPSWSVMRRGDSRGVFNAVYLEQAFGFPMLAMMQTHRWDIAAHTPPTVDGLRVPEGLKFLGLGRWLPRRVIIVGTLLDTALYGWLWFSVCAFPGIARRSIRRWRGACLGCGYDVRHARHERCPECGLKC